MPSPDVPYLSHFVLPPPFSAIVALLVALGLARAGMAWARLLAHRERATALEIALGFVTVTGLVAAAAHAVAWYGLAVLITLRVLAGFLIAANLAWCSRRQFDRAFEQIRALRDALVAASWLRRWIWIACAVTVFALLLGALAPPTDADTLTYHLAVPLDWLQHGAHSTPDWLHSRLAGLGEALNLLGLAAGTDCLGAVLQAAGALAATVALVSLARGAMEIDLALALVLACPLLSFMILTDKPQLLPSAATTIVVAFVMVSRRDDRRVPPLVWWSCWAALGFAVASKYSFLLSAGLAGLVLLHQAWKERRVPLMLGAAATAMLVVAVPVLVRTFMWYGDPISPTLEKFRPDSDFIVATFAAYLRNFEMDHSIASLVNAPYHVTFTTHPTLFTTVLGVGSLAGLLALWCQSQYYDVLFATIALAVLALAGGQLQARFFIEPYFWSGLLVVNSVRQMGKRPLRALLALQLGAALAVGVFSAALLFPGALTPAWRERVLMRSASEYRLNAWLNAGLPASAVVASDYGATLYLDRPSLPRDYARIVDQALLPEAEKRRLILAALSRHGVTTVLLHEPLAWSPYRRLWPELGAPVTSAEFRDAARNPWGKTESTRVWVYRFTPSTR